MKFYCSNTNYTAERIRESGREFENLEPITSAASAADFMRASDDVNINNFVYVRVVDSRRLGGISQAHAAEPSAY
jgi:hypothetical protein